MSLLDDQFVGWLDTQAQALDSGIARADSLLPMFAARGLTRVGVPESEGGSGGPLSSAVGAVADLAEHSLAAAFVFWAHRAFIECLLASPNRPLVHRLLPSLLGGTLAGAPGLSNAMKFLAGMDQMHVQLTQKAGASSLNGAIHFATNLRKQGFVLAAGARNNETGNLTIFAIPSDVLGVVREQDYDLVALRATDTASVRLNDVALGEDWCLHPDARDFLPKIRPALLAMQCGLGIGLARASLRAVRAASPGAPNAFTQEAAQLRRTVDEYWLELTEGIDNGRLHEQRHELVLARLRMVELAMSAVQLELQAHGGRGYVRGQAEGFNRRWREAAFLPIVTPTALQLKTELTKIPR